MEMKKLDKKDFSALVQAIEKAGSLFLGPVRRDDYITLAVPGEGGEILLEYDNLKLPLKRWFFPGSEVLYTWNSGEVIPAAAAPGQQTVIFGVRPCDAHALVFLDKVFGGDCPDPYYLEKRERAVIISLACSKPGDTCFCTAAGGGPVNTRGTDLCCYTLKDTLLFRPCSPRGKDFLADFSSLFREPGLEEPATVKQLYPDETAGDDVFDPVLLEQRLGGLSSVAPFWENLARQCLGCGVCTYLCPTCHCFSLHDEGAGKIRVQDSCLYPSFTCEASGHNPRNKKALRMRQRIMHKFKYACENSGELFCTGCGRCVEHCPVNIDLRETIAEVAG